MTARPSSDTATKAIRNLLTHRSAITAQRALLRGSYDTKTLRDALVDGVPVMERAFAAIADEAFVHKSVAATYCRRSETTWERHVATFGTKAELDARGVSEDRPNAESRREASERFYRFSFVKEVDLLIQGAQDRGEDRRSKALKARGPSGTFGELGKAVTDRIPWLTDPATGDIYTTIWVDGTDGEKLRARLLRRGARIEFLTFHAAMTERRWIAAPARQAFHDIYVGLLQAASKASQWHAEECESRWDAGSLSSTLNSFNSLKSRRDGRF